MSGWDAAGRWKWGRAGQRRDPVEAERVQRALAAKRNREELQGRARRETDDRVAHDLWRYGMLSPARISMVLDAQGLYGPEVDEACSAREPDVDLWEAGRLYPTWEQVLALCELVGCTPRFLMSGPGQIDWADTTMRFHLPKADRRVPVTKFTAKAVRDRVGEI